MIIKDKENHFVKNFNVYNISDFLPENRNDRESPSKKNSDSHANESMSPKDRLCPSISFSVFNPDQYDFTSTFKETGKSATISILKEKFVKIKGSPERNVSDEIESHTEVCSRKLLDNEKPFLKRSINTNDFQDKRYPKRTTNKLYQSIDEAIPVNCSEAEQAFHEGDCTELKEVCAKEGGTKYSVNGALQFIHQVCANCHLCKYFKHIYIKKEEAEASDEEIYTTANMCARCNNCEIEYPTTNNQHNLLKLDSIRLHKSCSSIDSSSISLCNYPRFYSNFNKCQLQFHRASDESSDYPGDSRIHGMPTTCSSDRKLIDLHNCKHGKETHSTCSSQDDRTSVIYRRKKWSVEEGSNRNFVRALAHRNAATRTNDTQQPNRPLWTVHYDNANYIRSFMSPHVVGNAFLVL